MTSSRRKCLAFVLAVAALLSVHCSSLADGIRAANSNVSTEAQKILNYLSTLPSRPDHRVISGQFFSDPANAWTRDPPAYVKDNYERWIGDLHAKTGKWVGLIGAEYDTYNYRNPGQPVDFTTLNELLTKYWEAGGFVTLYWTPKNPWTHGSHRDRSSIGSFGDIMADGTAVHTAWITELDEMASVLATLQRAGVVVLFRVFHEQNGPWSWWGIRDNNSPSKEEFSALWHQTFDYLTRVKKLDNLLWVFSPSNNEHVRPASYYFPGSDVVDIIGPDVYQDEINIPSYRALVHLGKPLGLGEYGPVHSTKSSPSFDYMRLIETIRAKYPAITFFQCWSHDSPDKVFGIVANRNADRLLNDPWIANRGDLVH